MELYEPLRAHLAAQSAPNVSLTFEEVEKLLGRPLPPSARGQHKRQWWANTDRHSQARAWLAAGCKARLDVGSSTVTFSRGPTAPPQEPGGTAPAPQGDAAGALSGGLISPGLTPAAQRMLQDVAEEAGVTVEAAAANVLNRMAVERRRRTLEWFQQNTVFSTMSGAELIRAERDGR